MDIKQQSVRNVILVILFVMILICSLLSVSYAYYSKSSKTDFILHNTNIECLNIYATNSDYSVMSSLPRYFMPISNSLALSLYDSGPLLNETSGERFGSISFRVSNGCTSEANVDFLMIPTGGSEFSLNNVDISYCVGSLWDCIAGWNTRSVKALGAGNYCYAKTTAPAGFWGYMGNTWVLDGVDKRMCSLLRQFDDNGLTVPSGANRSGTVRYWLDESVTNYEGKHLAFSFVAYTFKK